MSTQVEIYEGSLASSIQASGVNGVDPRRRRFGYSPGIFQMQLDPTQSGQQQAVMPAGVPIPFRTIPGKMEENFDIAVSVDEYQKQIYRDALATFFIANVKASYEEFGFRELSSLTMLDDPEREPSKEKKDGTVALGKIIPASYTKSAQGYFNAWHPSFAEVGYECPQGLDQCCTCRAWLLGIDFNASGETSEVEMSEVMQARIAKLPDQKIAEELRQQLIESNIAYHQFCMWKWALVTGELEKKHTTGEAGISHLSVAEHHVRRHIHAVAPSEQAALAASSFGAEVAAANSEGMRELAQAFRESKPGTSDDVLKAVVETQRQQGQILERLADAVLKDKATD